MVMHIVRRQRKRTAGVPVEPTTSAQAAGLRYVTDKIPGITRHRSGTGFRYVSPHGTTLRDAKEVQRIKSLAIPPAWTSVWICPNPLGHLQATGRDARGRKQHRYHPRWRLVRDEAKYHRILEFAEGLPAVRRAVDADLATPGLSRRKVIAAVVQLLEKTLIRVGNEEYARDNDSFGLTTLRARQVKVNGSKVRFHFRGKSGVEHAIELEDRRMASIVRRVRDLPGQELFQYVDEDGAQRSIGSDDVNAYLKEISGEDFTSKDFRTWAGTVLAARALARLGAFDSQAQAKRNVVTAVEAVAGLLGNTAAVCRKCYIHPAVIESYLEGRLDAATDAALLRLLRAAA
jgi:DNA topoisomerase-1